MLRFSELGVTENLLPLNFFFFFPSSIISQAPNLQFDFYPAVNQVIQCMDASSKAVRNGNETVIHRIFLKNVAEFSLLRPTILYILSLTRAFFSIILI